MWPEQVEYHSNQRQKFYSGLSRAAFGFQGAYRLSGSPVLVNTSFNVHSEPIVCSPEDAFRCFMGTDIELLVRAIALPAKKIKTLRYGIDYTDTFEPD